MKDFDKFLKNEKIDTSEISKKIRNEIIELVAEYYKNTHDKSEFIPGKSFLPYSGKTFNEKEIQYLVSASLDFWLTEGRFNKQFEERFSQYLQRNFVLTTNSGSSANLLAVSSLTSKLLGDRALKDYDEVLTVAGSFPTTINPILQNNLIPVFLDIEIPTYNIDVRRIESSITNKTKAIILAHTLGNPFDLKKIQAICQEHKLWLIEDCCDALGSKYNNQLVGSFGDISTFSFYPAHHITMGEGGAITTDNPILKKAIESIRDWGRDCFCAPGVNNTCGKRFKWKLGDLPEGFDHKYTFSHRGYNLKLTEMQAAVGLAQLDKLEYFNEKRKENYSYLRKKLEKFSEFLILPKETENSEPSWFGFPITVSSNAPFSREDLIFFLQIKNIDTRNIFSGNIIRQPFFNDEQFRVVGNLENTDLMMTNTFMIGVYPGLTKSMLDYIIQMLSEFFKQKEINF